MQSGKDLYTANNAAKDILATSPDPPLYNYAKDKVVCQNIAMSKVLIFGDSYTKLFQYFDISKNIICTTFSGKTAKSLFKNEIGKSIISVCKKYQGNIKCIILLFGQVDIHVSYYYNFAIKNNLEFDYLQIMQNYAAFIKQLLPFTNHIYVVNILPNTADLYSYHIFLKRILNIDSNSEYIVSRIKELISPRKSSVSLQMANSLLTAELKKINSQKITFIDMNKYMFTDIKEYLIDPIYITLSRFDLHVLWESFLWCFLNKYKTCISSDDFPSLKSILEMQESKFRKYIRKLTSVSYANS